MRNNNPLLLSDISSVILIDEATVEIRIDQDIDFELDDAIRMNQIIQEIGASRILYHLTIFGNRTAPSKQARTYSLSEIGSRFKKAEAIVVQSLSQKMVFNFMINAEHPSVRTKLFTDRDNARKWLQSLNV
ncbi:MAG: hypothetical protein COA38_03405 [Fluviicola sp.]|nr:MAG: hypothetical protein COA38_03405 [Fluviicola sp.]